MTQKHTPLSSYELDIYTSSIKKAQKKEMSEFTKDYFRAFILALIFTPIVYVLYVSFSIVLKVVFESGITL